MSTMYLLVALFTYSTHADGGPPFALTHLYQAEFTAEACVAARQQIVRKPALYVRALTGSKPTMVDTVILAGWSCVAMEFER